MKSDMLTMLLECTNIAKEIENNKFLSKEGKKYCASFLKGTKKHFEIITNLDEKDLDAVNEEIKQIREIKDTLEKYKAECKKLEEEAEKKKVFNLDIDENDSNKKLKEDILDIMNENNSIIEKLIQASKEEKTKGLITEEDLKLIEEKRANLSEAFEILKINKNANVLKCIKTNLKKDNEELADILAIVLDAEEAKKTTKKKVTKVESGKCKDKNLSLREKLLMAGVAVLALIIIAGTIVIVKLTNKDNNNGNKNPDTSEEPSISVDADDIIGCDINNIDINDDAKLTAYALQVVEGLKEKGIVLSIEDVVKAIKLTNFNEGNEKLFETKEEGLKATLDAGKIFTKLGSKSIIKSSVQNDVIIKADVLNDMIKNVTDGSLTLDKLGFASVEQIDIYKLLDKLVEVVESTNNNYSESEKIQAAKLINEITTRKVRSFTLTPESSLGQYYAVLGMFNAEKENLERLTAGRLWGPIYGDTEKIDGSYGFICIEELENYAMIYEQNGKYGYNYGNYFYNDLFTDELVKNDSLTK